METDIAVMEPAVDTSPAAQEELDTLYPFSGEGVISRIFTDGSDLYALKYVSGEEDPYLRGLYRLDPVLETGQLLTCISGETFSCSNGKIYFNQVNRVYCYDIATGTTSTVLEWAEADTVTVDAVSDSYLCFCACLRNSDYTIRSLKYYFADLNSGEITALTDDEEDPTWMFVAMEDNTVFFYTLTSPREFCSKRPGEPLTVLASGEPADLHIRKCVILDDTCWFSSGEESLLTGISLTDPDCVTRIGEPPSAGEAMDIQIYNGSVYLLWQTLRSSRIYRLDTDGQIYEIYRQFGDEYPDAYGFCITDDGIALKYRSTWEWISWSQIN